jgi:hypothetical protein
LYTVLGYHFLLTAFLLMLGYHFLLTAFPLMLENNFLLTAFFLMQGLRCTQSPSV